MFSLPQIKREKYNSTVPNFWGFLLALNKPRKINQIPEKPRKGKEKKTITGMGMGVGENRERGSREEICHVRQHALLLVLVF